MREISGERVRLMTTVEADVPSLVAIRETPEVRAWWRGRKDLAAEIREDLAAEDYEALTITDQDGVIIGGIYFEEEDDPDYRHASIDIFLDPSVHGHGLGTESLRLLAGFLFEELGHHRLTIDPATDNAAAIRSYEKVGFTAVGVMRQYEMGSDGTWHDGLLMDLLAEEFAP